MDADPYLSILNLLCGITPQLGENLMTVHAPTLESVIALIIAVMSLMVSAFISGSETAFFSLTEADIESVDNDQKQERIRQLLAKPERLLATILIANNLVNVAIVVLCNFVMSQVFEFRVEWLDFLFQTVVLTFLLLLFGEILPKLYSNSHNVQWAKFAVNGIVFFSRLFGPASRLMAMSTSVVNRVVTKKSDNLSLDDLSHALEITDVEEGKEKDMLEGILKFGGKTVSDIMTPRMDITDVDWDSSFSDLMKLIQETGYSRIPVYVENQDNIKGFICAKDLLPYINRADDNSVGNR